MPIDMIGILTDRELIDVKERAILRIVRLCRERKVTVEECDALSRRCRDEIRELQQDAGTTK